MARNIFKGLGIALITPFTLDGKVDYKSLKRLLEYQLANGADFLCILATTGEAPCLTGQEKDELTAFIKDIVRGRIPILIILLRLLKRLRLQIGLELTVSLAFVHIITNLLRKVFISISKR